VGERLGDLLARGREVHQAHAARTLRAHRHVDGEHPGQQPRPWVSGRPLARRRWLEHDGVRAVLLGPLVLETSDWRNLVYHAGSPLIGAVWHAGERVA